LQAIVVDDGLHCLVESWTWNTVWIGRLLSSLLFPKVNQGFLDVEYGAQCPRNINDSASMIVSFCIIEDYGEKGASFAVSTPY